MCCNDNINNMQLPTAALPHRSVQMIASLQTREQSIRYFHISKMVSVVQDNTQESKFMNHARKVDGHLATISLDKTVEKIPPCEYAPLDLSELFLCLQ
ncbi:hypothetical protein LOAG_15140 [Loa loa]|uniref:Uncharacterized protein n=1 Tax=Loa loa TaxID=7209 RepID=A0A1S0TGC3_LOALO|nr:hypothetical protein LOAG_15140 [Loa loa]EFO13389.1 hypothetical protein LOAG_15140 [Loa loa]